MGCKDMHCFGGCQGFTRVVLIAINVFFLLAGILIVILGAVAMNHAKTFEDNASIFTYFQARVSSAILVATGAGSIATALFGLAGAYFRWTTCLKIYTVFMFLVCALQLAIGIFLFTRNVNTQEGDYWFDPTTDGYNNRVEYQNYLRCCGWHTTTDTQTQPWGPTICPSSGYNSTTSTTSLPPCEKATEDWVHKYINPISIAAITLSVLQFIALAGSCFIIMVTRKDGDDFYTSAYHY